MPLPRKEDSNKNNGIGGPSGLNGKTISSVNAWQHGTVFVVEVVHSTGTIFVKFNQNQCEFGGDANWGSGTRAF